MLLDGEPEVNEVFFDNVEVPAENLIGEENLGFVHLMQNLRTAIEDNNGFLFSHTGETGTHE